MHRSRTRRLLWGIWLLVVCAVVGSAAALSPALAASSPSATTGAATSVTQTSATLTGTLNTAGLTGAYYFVYGTSTSYTESTPVQTTTGTSSDQPVSAAVTGLTPGTTYHFELVAQVPAGVAPYSANVHGGDQQFTTNSSTGPPPPGGSIKLLSKKLTVKNGALTVSLKCASTETCRGGLSITTTKPVGTVLLTVRCVASKRFTITAGARGKVKAAVRGPCLTLLGNATNHRHRARLIASPSNGQAILATGVTLVLK